MIVGIRDLNLKISRGANHDRLNQFFVPAIDGAVRRGLGDADVDLNDRAALMGAYGENTIDCFGDLTGNDAVDLDDLAQLVGRYGTTSGARYEDGDLDLDGDVDLDDLATLLGVYGTGCAD